MDAIGAEIETGRLDAIIAEQTNGRKLVNDKGQVISDPWPSFSMVDAYADRPPVEYIAGRLFEKPSLNILYGAPSTLKSFLLADLLTCVAAGAEWLTPAPWQDGGSGYKTKQAPVMWLDFDNGQRRTLDRFKALGRARSLSADIPTILYSMPNPWLVSTDKTSIGMLALRIKAAGAEFVCIDNLGAVLGNAEENAAEMARVMSNYRQIAEDTGAAITIIHHQRKSNGLGGRAGDSLRGHSSIEAALDLALMVEREPYAEAISITATKTRGDDVLPFRAQFTFDHNDRGELDTARFWGLGTDDNLSETAITREIKNALVDEELSQTALIKAVKEALPDVGMNRIRDCIVRTAKNGGIRESKGSNYKKVYSV
jgi:hypothetical protein